MCKEAHTLRHVLSSLPYNFHDTQYKALELRQYFMMCHLTWLKVWQKWCETASEADGSPHFLCLVWPMWTKNQTQAIQVLDEPRTDKSSYE